MTDYGVIIGQANPNFFEFNIASPEAKPRSYEYVQIELEEQLPDGTTKKVDVLGQVKSLYSRHPFYDQRTTPAAVWKQRELGLGGEMLQVIASVKILGYIHEEHGRRDVRRPRTPPMPGTPVKRATDALLNELFTLQEQDLPLDVGHLLHRESVKIPISGRELHRHTAILAMTRYGKSWFAGRIIEELLRPGATAQGLEGQLPHFAVPSRRHQRFRVRMRRFAKQREYIRILHHSTGIHNGDPMTHIRDHTHVMGYYEDSCVPFPAKGFHQFQNLGLYRNIQRCGRLICNQQLRPVRPRTCRHIGLTPVARIGQGCPGAFLYTRCLQDMLKGLEHRLQLLHVIFLLGYPHRHDDLVLTHDCLNIVPLYVALTGLHDPATRIGGVDFDLLSRHRLHHLGLPSPLLLASNHLFRLPLCYVFLG